MKESYSVREKAKKILKRGLKRRRTVVASFLFFAGFSAFFINFALSGARNPLDLERKISPVLREEVALLSSNPRYDHPMPVIVQVTREFFAHNELARAHNERPSNALSLVQGYSARLTAAQIKLLLQSNLIEYVTLDVPVRSTSGGRGDSGSAVSLLNATIGADQVDATGSSVTVALFDSGIARHSDLEPRRIKAAVDFTSGEPVLRQANVDGYGHGTHVAGIIGGTGKASGGTYSGVARNVDFVDLKVIGSEGWGHTSHLIKAIDWLIRNKDRYNVRIANFSLGHPPVESYTRDPLCQAVEKLIDAGVISIASAGNLGKTDRYSKIWGSIGSPGIDPTVITVYPINTRGTVTHSDDIATSYGSRGPSIDNLFKPDISAPGNRVIAPLAAGSFLHQQYPDLTVDGNYMMLSGSSMATAVVSGTAALMLEQNPKLNHHLTKLILVLTAIKLRQPLMLEQGNGLVNAKTAVEIAKSLDPVTHQLRYAVSPSWVLKGETVWSGGAFAYANQIVYSRLLASRGSFWGNDADWSGALYRNGSDDWVNAIVGNGAFWSEGVLWSGAIAWSDEILWSDGMFWSDARGIFWSEGMFWSDAQGIFWSDASGIFWSDVEP